MQRFVRILLLVSALVGIALAMSDTYGHNPQHEFGAVFGQSANSLIPFWHLEGDAYANEDFVRLVPDRQSKRGGIWNTEPNRFANWEATFAIHIHGQGNLGADGMAFWYTKETSRLDGGFFGFTDQFSGLGIVLDTYDNDNTGLHPLLVGIVNDGTKKYTHQHHAEEDGGSPTNMEVGNCQLHVRNLPGTTFIRVTYRNKQLKVEHQLYGQNAFSLCMVANNIELPPRYHFGFTAATGHQADDHDLYGYSIRNLDANAPTIDSQRLFSNYDKYQVSEYLSQITYSLNQKALLNAAGGSSSGAISGDVNSRLLGLEGSIAQLQSSIQELTNNINNKGAGGSTNLLPFQNDLAAIKNTVNQVLRQVGTATGVIKDNTNNNEQNADKTNKNNENNNNNNEQQARRSTWTAPSAGIPDSLPLSSSGGSGSWLWTIVYVLLGFIGLGLVYIAWLYYRVRSEREKKYF
eukprot:TRINITY_DN1427_c0_g1_i1.p1 TRINITY_DN1427_c0_g1~~TRINITY_DN1427_c0_g1_i1.p1  ORF type:complete len:462 (+),score=105.77 TRINITY_DN1427_c0_g1_i1:243-1628(+)